MYEYIELDRRFRELTEEEREDPEMLALFDGHEPYFGMTWNELLKSERVIILAEAGSGKTLEMQTQKKHLVAKNHAAFFIPIEVLDTEDIRSYLAMEPGEVERFDAWIADGEKCGWIFLDAVDELKLRNGKLEMALGKLARALGTSYNRARIFISCRPSDWRPSKDMEIFQKIMPIVESSIHVLTGNEAFLAPLRKSHNALEQKRSTVKYRCVVMQPLGKNQIEAFARANGVKNPKALITEIKRRAGWSFARRPMDLQRLINSWKTNGNLGSLRQQHRINIEDLLQDDPERPDSGLLSIEQTHDGAERLALAMLLTKTRTILAPEQFSTDNNTSSLNAFTILADWKPAEVKSLLRRPIFDPATYGRIRFHHRNTQEFLAASRLKTLCNKGLTKRKILSHFFAYKYGEQVVIPSMRPVAAWLSDENADICRELLKREPEILILYGDPETLPVNVRVQLVRRYVAAYSNGTWRGIDMPAEKVQRLAFPDLACEIKHCWYMPHSNEEVRNFLLKLIWLGAIHECTEIAFNAAMDLGLEPYARILAIRALSDCQQHDLLRKIADDMLTNPKRWPDRIVYSTADEIFPNTISTAELIQLIRQTPEPKQTADGFSGTLYKLAETLEPHSKAATSLRNALRELIWEGRESVQKWYNPISKYSYLTPALTKLCLCKIQIDGTADKNWIYASIIAKHFHNNNTLGQEDIQQLSSFFAQEHAYHETIFWAELKIMDAIAPETKNDHRVYNARYHSLFSNITINDWDWLIRALKKANPPMRRDVALRMLIPLWFQRGQIKSEMFILKRSVQDDPNLIEILKQNTTIQPSVLDLGKWEKEKLTSPSENEAKQQHIERTWLEWKAKIEADPATYFKSKLRSHTFWTLMEWLGLGRKSNTLVLKNWPEIRRIFGNTIGELFEKQLQIFWRKNIPPIWSRRSPVDYNKIFGKQYAALTGLAMEAASNPNWARNLSPAQALRAAEWGLTEINGFPEWYMPLVETHPNTVHATLVSELKAELDTTITSDYPHTLSAISNSENELKCLVSSSLKTILIEWPLPPRKNEKENSYNQKLGYVLSILVAAGQVDESILQICENRFYTERSRPSATIWLRTLFACNAKRGIQALNRGIKASRKERAIKWFGEIFGGHDHSRIQVSIDIEVLLLVQILKLAYKYICYQGDNQHEGIYTPDARDHAERARSRLLGALIEKSGFEAYQALIELSNEPLFTHMSDRLRFQARQRAAQDSEATALSQSEYRVWEKRYETSPKTCDELFQVLLDRLDDIEYEIRHHDFSDRPTLLLIEHETKMQPHLAKKLEDAARDQYHVARESEVADKKETDIILFSSASTAQCVIEIKIGDNCSVMELEGALKEQLLKQYLRHSSRTAGCLLVTYAGRKGFKDPETDSPLSFEEVIARIKRYAAFLENREQGRIKLEVFALDLRNPLDF